MEERREQFEYSYCGKKLNFKNDAEEHERNCPERETGPWKPRTSDRAARGMKARSAHGKQG
jgi:hypothetical protein